MPDVCVCVCEVERARRKCLSVHCDTQGSDVQSASWNTIISDMYVLSFHIYHSVHQPHQRQAGQAGAIIID